MTTTTKDPHQALFSIDLIRLVTKEAEDIATVIGRQSFMLKLLIRQENVCPIGYLNTKRMGVTVVVQVTKKILDDRHSATEQAESIVELLNGKFPVKAKLLKRLPNNFCGI